MTTFTQRVAEDCTKISKELRSMADRLKQSGLTSDAAICIVMAHRLDDLIMDTMTETQPIELPKK